MVIIGGGLVNVKIVNLHQKQINIKLNLVQIFRAMLIHYSTDHTCVKRKDLNQIVVLEMNAR